MDSRVLGSLLTVSRCFRLYCARTLGDTELRPAQQYLLSHVCRRPGLPQEALIAALHLDKTTVAHQLMRLEDLGYIRREVPAEDGRCRLVYPTDKALAVYPRIREDFEAFARGILRGFSDEEKAELEALAERIRQNALALPEQEGGEEG